MSEFRINKITNRVGDTGTQICGVSTFSGSDGMILPSGPTEYRGGRGRGISVGGSTGPSTINAGVNELEYVTIQTLGDAVDFGDLTKELSLIHI